MLSGRHLKLIARIALAAMLALALVPTLSRAWAAPGTEAPAGPLLAAAPGALCSSSTGERVVLDACPMCILGAVGFLAPRAELPVPPAVAGVVAARVPPGRPAGPDPAWRPCARAPPQG